MEDGANAVKKQTAKPMQLSLFDAVQPITMNTDPTLIEEHATEDVGANAADTMALFAQSKSADEDAPSLGLRLRAARVAREWSVETVAQQLKLPHTVIEALEAEHFDRIGQGIFLRGYLAKYLQLLDLPQSLASSVLDQQDDLPPLVTSGTISRPRYLFDRYSGSALYLILTGVIIVPAVLLAVHAGLDKPIVRFAPLDEPIASAKTHAVPDLAHADAFAASGKTSSAEKLETSPDETQVPAVMASMATFIATTPDASASVSAPTPQPVVSEPPAVASDAAVEAGSHSLHLQLVESSWVEIVDGTGKQLEYALLPAGSVRDYQSKQSLSVLLGNAVGASIRVDGKPRDLSPFMRGNVARLKLADDNWTMSPSGG